MKSPDQKIETREQPDLQGPKSYMGGRVGAVQILTGKMGKKRWSLGPLGFNIETGEGFKYLISNG